MRHVQTFAECRLETRSAFPFAPKLLRPLAQLTTAGLLYGAYSESDAWKGYPITEGGIDDGLQKVPEQVWADYLDWQQQAKVEQLVTD